MNMFLFGTSILSSIPSELLWVVGILLTAYLVIKVIVRTIMRVITIVIATIITYLIKAGIFAHFFQ